MKKIFFLAAVVCSGAVFAENTDEGLVEQEDKNAWHFRVGPVMAPRVRVKIGGPRMILPASSRSRSDTSGSSGSVPAGPSAGYVERQYVDGYVRPDEGTDDGDSFIAGLTWDWGANNVPAQYSGGMVEFHTDMARWTESVSSSVYSDGSSGSESDTDALFGVEAMGGWTFYDEGKFDASLDAGFRFYGSGDLSAESRYGTSVTTIRNEYRYIDSYDASGWTDVPGGSHSGSAGGPGRLIGAMPMRREELMDSTAFTETYYRSFSTKLDYGIWDLRLGPTMGWKATDYLTIRGGLYGLIGLVDAELKTAGNTGSRRGNVKKSKCDAVFGIAAGISAQLYLTDNLFLVGGAEYDWWADDVNLNAGGTDARIELSDFSVSVGLGFAF